jgi:hypothetical protein
MDRKGAYFRQHTTATAPRAQTRKARPQHTSSIDFADVYIDLKDTEAGFDRLSATEMPHRLSDAILRDSEALQQGRVRKKDSVHHVK